MPISVKSQRHIHLIVLFTNLKRPMPEPIDLERFLRAQSDCYERVKREMENGHKQSCWIWYIFPQIEISKTGVSPYHIRYAIHSLDEAKAYLEHPILGARLRELSEIVLTHRDIPIDEIMGWSLDAMKFNSSMSLFSLVSEPGSVFHRVLDQFFGGKRCPLTLKKFGDTRERQLGEEAEDRKQKRDPAAQSKVSPTLARFGGVGRAGLSGSYRPRGTTLTFS
jgi:uncharacterized protein (DUF1810 family)